MKSVSVWPRLEPFLLAALQAAPPVKLSMHYLRKMARYVRTREGCFPRLGWHMWRHIACGKLQLPEELAWLYFETFNLLVQYSAGDKLEWAEALSQRQTPRDLDQQRSKLSLDTLQFLLFLYLQQLNRVSLRTSLIGEEWPSPRSHSPSSSSERETKSITQNKNWDEQAHLTFVQTHLGELLELLAEPGELGGSDQALREISVDALQALDLILEGSINHGRSVLAFHHLISCSPIQPHVVYSKLSHSYSLQRLQSWLHQTLILNPFGISDCRRSSKKLGWTQQGKVEDVMRRAKITGNMAIAPLGSRVLVMSHVYRQTLAKDSEKLAGTNVKLHRCSESYIYLLSPLRSVTLDKCHDSTVVLGPVETSVHVQSCKNIRLVCVAGRLVVGSSTRCTIHVLTPTRPLFLPGNTSLTLGPFHTYYPSLEDHMASVGLAVIPNLWDQPLMFAQDSPTSDPGCYCMLPPDLLCPMVVPFVMEGDTCEVPGGLPITYQQALEARQQRVHNWQKRVKDSHLNKEQRRQLRAVVEQKFHEWLVETGQRQELDSLLPPRLAPSSITQQSNLINSNHVSEPSQLYTAKASTPTIC